MSFALTHFKDISITQWEGLCVGTDTIDQGHHTPIKFRQDFFPDDTLDRSFASWAGRSFSHTSNVKGLTTKNNNNSDTPLLIKNIILQHNQAIMGDSNQQQRNTTLSTLWDIKPMTSGFAFSPEHVEHPKPQRKKTVVADELMSSDNDPTEVTFFHDFVAGGLAGSASVIVGHPFDTVRRNRRNEKYHTNLFNCSICKAYMVMS